MHDHDWAPDLNVPFHLPDLGFPFNLRPAAIMMMMIAVIDRDKENILILTSVSQRSSDDCCNRKT